MGSRRVFMGASLALSWCYYDKKSYRNSTMLVANHGNVTAFSDGHPRDPQTRSAPAHRRDGAYPTTEFNLRFMATTSA